MLPDLTVCDKIDRLPILVSHLGNSQLLPASKLESGTGEAQATAVVETLKKWDIQNQVQGMCFDTTSSNSGRNNVACVIIELLIGKDLLYFRCRHHILELIAGVAFSEVLRASSGPKIIMFKELEAKWG